MFEHFDGAQAAGGPEQPGFAALVTLVAADHAYVKVSAGRELDPGAPFFDIDDGLALNQLQFWARSAAAGREILVDNPARLYDF